jgi:hypothetical protein
VKAARAAAEPRRPPRPSPPARSTWGAIADAVGHCLLVFTFVPPLAALPGWLQREAAHALNREEPVVLMFLPVRGVNVLLSAFYAGILPGILSGLATGIVLAAWEPRRGADAPRLAGAVSGALGAAFSVLVTLVVAVQRGGTWSIPAPAVAFEVGAGLVCGAIAGPTAVRLLRGGRTPAQE